MNSLFTASSRSGRRVHGEITFVVGAGKTTAAVTSMFYLMRKERRPPATAEFVLFMLSQKRREDVFNDLNDWYGFTPRCVVVTLKGKGRRDEPHPRSSVGTASCRVQGNKGVATWMRQDVGQASGSKL